MDRPESTAGLPLVATGISGIDDILGGGLTPNRLYLVEGHPGAGKTTLGMRYLLEGARLGEKVLYVTLSETEAELRDIAHAHGFSLDGVDIVELIPSEDSLSLDAQYTMFHPSEVELIETTRAVLAEVDKRKPQRVVFDSLSEMRLLAQNPLRYRRQVMALKHFFLGRNCTVLLLDDRSPEPYEMQLQTMVHGVLSLEQMAPEYGAERRRLRVVKMRGRPYRGGYHDFTIVKGGLDVFPRLVAAEHHRNFAHDSLVESGIEQIDTLLGGGLLRGSSTLLMGPAGVGKSSMALQFALSAAERGEPAAVFAFDESRETILQRSKGMNMDLRPHLDSGLVTLQQIDPAELSPGEFAHAVRHATEANGARLVIIDSLNGYLNAMPEERFLLIQLHELFTYLNQLGVTTLLVVAQPNFMGERMESPVDASYLADSIILFRYFETQGEVRKAVAAIKKRSGPHEKSIRELTIDADGLHVGEPLREFQGILTGVPLIRDQLGTLLSQDHNGD